MTRATGPRSLIAAPLDHLAIHVADREAAETVARELLGARAVTDVEVPGAVGSAHLRVMEDVDSRFMLVLCDADSEQHPIRQWVDARGPGVHHLAHRVERVEASLAQVVGSGGAAVGDIVDAPGLRQVFVDVADDGILHELTQRVEGGAEFDPASTEKLIQAGGARGMNPDAPPLRHGR